LSSEWSLITHQLFWGNLSDKLLLFGDEMHLRCLLATKVIHLPKRKTLIPHENSWLLCKRIEPGSIIVRWHLLLHILLLILPLTNITLRLLANSATRLAPRVAAVALSWRKHHLLFFFLFSIV
jgi:hypothetical protein